MNNQEIREHKRTIRREVRNWITLGVAIVGVGFGIAGLVNSIVARISISVYHKDS